MTYLASIDKFVSTIRRILARKIGNDSCACTILIQHKMKGKNGVLNDRLLGSHN